jgi:protein lifeguard
MSYPSAYPPNTQATIQEKYSPSPGFHSVTARPYLSDYTPNYIKNRTVCKVYCLVSMMLCVTTASSVGMYVSESARQWVAQHPSFYIVAIVLSFVSVISLFCVKEKHPHNLICMGILNLSMSYMVGIVCLSYSPHIVIQAAIATTVATVCSSLIAFCLRHKNITPLGNYLFCILCVMMVLGLFRIFIDFGSVLNTLYAAIGSLLFTAYIVFDTWWLLSRASSDDAVVVAVNLYLDIINLFLYLLQLFDEIKK